MLATCRQAVEWGLPAVAFTEHADFTAWMAAPAATLWRPATGGSSKDAVDPHAGHVAGGPWPVRVTASPIRRGELDIRGYWKAIDRCRAAFPGLRIESGVELGEPHLFPEQVARLLARRPLDRLLGSQHSIEVDGELVDMSAPGLLSPEHAEARFRVHLAATLVLVESSAPFAILTHIDYGKRFWPHAQVRFDERDFEDEYRAVLRALARSGRALEINSSRDMGPPRGPSPGPLPLRWWHEAGGGAVSFGSDAHRPGHLAAGLAGAAAMAEAAGFRRGSDPLQLWLRG
jgi:histidinol-phosphatase (PHP family)